VFEGASFADFGSALQKRYGKAKTKSGVRHPGTPSTQWLEWNQPGVLARAVDNNEFYGFYCLILEDPKTVSQLGKLRKNRADEAAAGGELVDMVEAQSDEDQNSDIADRITGEIRRQDRPEVVDSK
jgi:hypothetical protein